MKYADQSVIIPQAPGFVDSFNVSVACAITLYEARRSRERALGKHADLDPLQQDILTAAMLLRHKVRFRNISYISKVFVALCVGFLRSEIHIPFGFQGFLDLAASEKSIASGSCKCVLTDFQNTCE